MLQQKSRKTSKSFSSPEKSVILPACYYQDGTTITCPGSEYPKQLISKYTVQDSERLALAT
jgi:hypothetical protein